MPTTNPVPSTDPTDLLFNAQKLDEVVSGSTQYYTDRLGVNRRTVEGISAAADVVLGGLGYAPPVTYASGISLTLTTQTVEYSGEIYAPKVASLPFTTSTWATDSAKFRLMIASDASRVNYTPAGTGAVATTVQAKLREVVSVKDFGAVGDGVTDDTVAIQSAIDYGFLNSTQYGKALIVVPPGTYKISDTLLYGSKAGHDLRYAPNVSGEGYPRIVYSGEAGKPAFHAGNNGNGYVLYSQISNLSFEFAGASVTGTTGILAQAAHYMTWSGVSSNGFETGLNNKGSIGCTFDFKRKSVSATNQCINIAFESDEIIGLKANVCRYENVRLSGTGNTTGVNGLIFGGAVSFENVVFEGGLELGFQLKTNGEVSAPPYIWDRVSMKNCWFESITAYAGSVEACHLELHNCFIANSLKVLKKDGVSRLYFNGTANYNGTFVDVASDDHASNVYFNGVPWGGLPHSRYPAYGDATVYFTPYVDRQVFHVRYDSRYPAGNNDSNYGLTLNLLTEYAKVFGSRWTLGRMIFCGSDGGTTYYMEVFLRRDALTHIVSTNAPAGAYTKTGNSITFNNNGTGGWYGMNVTFIKEYSDQY